MMKIEHQNVSREVEALFQDGVLVDLTIGYWSALLRNTAQDLGVDPAELPKMVAGLGTKRLVPKEISAEWRTLAGSARYTLRRYSYPFPVSETNFVPVKALGIVEGKLNSVRDAFMKKCDGLCANIESIRDEWLRQQPKEHRDRLLRLYPPTDVIRSKFYFTWSIFSVTIPKRTALVVASRKKAAAKVEASEREEQKRMLLAHQAEQRYAAEIEQRMQSFLNDVIGTMRGKVVAMCADTLDGLKSGKLVTNRSLNTMRSFIERYRVMNFLNDAEITRHLDTLAHEIGGQNADTFTDEAARAELTRTLDALNKAAANVTDVSAITGTYRRRIVLPEEAD